MWRITTQCARRRGGEAVDIHRHVNGPAEYNAPSNFKYEIIINPRRDNENVSWPRSDHEYTLLN